MVRNQKRQSLVNNLPYCPFRIGKLLFSTTPVYSSWTWGCASLEKALCHSNSAFFSYNHHFVPTESSSQRLGYLRSSLHCNRAASSLFYAFSDSPRERTLRGI